MCGRSHTAGAPGALRRHGGGQQKAAGTTSCKILSLKVLFPHGSGLFLTALQARLPSKPSLRNARNFPASSHCCSTRQGTRSKTLTPALQRSFGAVFNKLVFKKQFEMRDEASTAEAADARPSSLGYPVDKWI